MKVNCTDVVVAKAADAAALQRTLYCGYFQARCSGTPTTNAHAAAFDWRDTGAARFAPDMLYNNTYAASEDATSGNAPYQRLPQVRHQCWDARWCGSARAVSVCGTLLLAEVRPGWVCLTSCNRNCRVWCGWLESSKCVEHMQLRCASGLDGHHGLHTCSSGLQPATVC
eukprot:GHRQ01039937.1.p1 GENE.GHRQ01039937.1~~GHRQ01039937.1.p1  ORF type:complete len:169 (-),score=30.13 GHRQ01039937.1:125-631(-)